MGAARSKSKYNIDLRLTRKFKLIVATSKEEALGKAFGLAEAWIARKGIKEGILCIEDEGHNVEEVSNGQS